MMLVFMSVKVLVIVTAASRGIREYLIVILGMLSLSYLIHLDIIYLLYAIFLFLKGAVEIKVVNIMLQSHRESLAGGHASKINSLR